MELYAYDYNQHNNGGDNIASSNVVPSPIIPSGRSYSHNFNHPATTSTSCKRPIFFKSHSASEVLSAPREHSTRFTNSLMNRADGLSMPTPKRSKSVGSAPRQPSYQYVVDDDEESNTLLFSDGAHHPNKPSHSSLPVVTPNRGFRGTAVPNYYPQGEHNHYGWRMMNNNGLETMNAVEKKPEPFQVIPHMAMSRQEGQDIYERSDAMIPRPPPLLAPSSFFYQYNHNTVAAAATATAHVTPSSSCDYGDSFRSLPTLETCCDTDMMDPVQTPDLYEPYNILEAGVDDIEPYEVLNTNHPAKVATAHIPGSSTSQSHVHDAMPMNTYFEEDHLSESRPLPTISTSPTNDPEQMVQDRSSSSHDNVHGSSSVLPFSSITSSPSSRCSTDKPQGEARFKDFHEKKWNEHLQELRDFRKKHGHCLVPHTYPENQSLARWVKRQRRQYKLMQDGDLTSAMTQDRVDLLNKEGFVWDSHEVVWRERYEQLRRYKDIHGHCRVPSYCKENPQLATWVKCQRRQYKLFWEGKRSSMSAERTKLLEDIGFVWEVRSEKYTHSQEKDSMRQLAEILNDM